MAIFVSSSPKMPSSTFHKLKPEKKKLFIKTAIQEFSGHNFDTASINVIIQNMNIARGSVYQYFSDKLDLWNFLLEVSENKRLSYIQSISRLDYPDFWEFLNEYLFAHSRFEIECPEYALFLHRLSSLETAEVLQPVIQERKQRQRNIYLQMIEFEKLNGNIHPAISESAALEYLLSLYPAVHSLRKNSLARHLSEDEQVALQRELIHLYKRGLCP